jgi:hypothetical protein
MLQNLFGRPAKLCTMIGPLQFLQTSPFAIWHTSPFSQDTEGIIAQKYL